MSHKLNLKIILEVNRLFIAKQREINAALMNTFLGVALWGGEDEKSGEPLSILVLARKVDLSPTTVSRHLRYLGYLRRKGVAGMGLVETYPSHEDNRQKLVRLSSEGEALVAKLFKVVSSQ